MNHRPQLQSVLAAAAGLLFMAACGGNGDTAGPQASPTLPNQTPAARGPIAPPTYCQVSIPADPSMNLQVQARWEGEDRIIAEGTIGPIGRARLQGWVCQDGQMTAALQLERQPELKNGKIKAEWKVVDVDVGPVFDAGAGFEVVLAAVGEPVALPYFVVRIPVEGRPE